MSISKHFRKTQEKEVVFKFDLRNGNSTHASMVYKRLLIVIIDIKNILALNYK